MGCGTSFTAAFGNFTAMRISARIGQQDADDCNHNIDISYYIYMGVSKNREYPQMHGENNGKPY